MGSDLFWMEMAVQHYCVLESIGRGRHMGMYSFGPASLQVYCREVVSPNTCDDNYLFGLLSGGDESRPPHNVLH
jgi:hypothetical protein